MFLLVVQVEAVRIEPMIISIVTNYTSGTEDNVSLHLFCYYSDDT
jgi:hypothetical protein